MVGMAKAGDSPFQFGFDEAATIAKFRGDSSGKWDLIILYSVHQQGFVGYPSKRSHLCHRFQYFPEINGYGCVIKPHSDDLLRVTDRSRTNTAGLKAQNLHFLCNFKIKTKRLPPIPGMGKLYFTAMQQ